MNAYETALALALLANAEEDGTIDSYAHSSLKSVQKLLLPKTGYYVGGVRPSLVVSNGADVDREDLALFVNDSKSRYFGVWADVADGKVYFDAVTLVDDREEAIALGRERGEIAIWDIKNSEEIRVNGDQSKIAA